MLKSAEDQKNALHAQWQKKITDLTEANRKMKEDHHL